MKWRFIWTSENETLNLPNGQFWNVIVNNYSEWVVYKNGTYAGKFFDCKKQAKQYIEEIVIMDILKA